MAGAARILITGSGAICAAGKSPREIWETLQSGQSAIGPIGLWDTAGWPRRHAGEVRNLEPAKLLGDRKILKFIRRSDVFGLYAGGRAIEAAGIARGGTDWTGMPARSTATAPASTSARAEAPTTASTTTFRS